MVAGSDVVFQLVLGVSFGVLLVLVAMGLSLVFGIMGVINFAHGAIMMLGAYVGYQTFLITQNFFLALAVAPVVVGLVSMAIEPVILRPLYDFDPLYQLLSTWGAALVITESIRIVWGLDAVPFDSPPLLSGRVALLGRGFPVYRLFLIAIAVATIVALLVMLNRSNFGIIVRASTYKADPIVLSGINLNRTFTVVFGLAGALAALAGVLVGPVSVVSPELGNDWIVQAFIVTVVGGLGSIRGAVIAGVIIGVVNSLFILWYPALSGFVIYMIMAVTIILRPEGLMGMEAYNE